MFKDKYKKDNEIINPDTEKLNEMENIIRFGYKEKNKKPIFAMVATFIILIFSILMFKDVVFKANNTPSKNMAINNSSTTTVNNGATYEDIYNSLNKIASKDNSLAETNMMEKNYAGDGSSSKETGGSRETSDYSDTNVQVSGVHEGDIVKTDGKYIYSLKNNTIYISKVSSGNLEPSSKININNSDNHNFLEMYIQDNKLIVISQKILFDNNLNKEIAYDCAYFNGDTTLDIYDISDKSNPNLISTLTQNGTYSSSRMIDNKLYTISNYNLNLNNISKDDPESFIPNISSVKEDKCLEPDDIYISSELNNSNYVLATSLDIENPYEYESSKGVLGASNDIYMSLENLYISSYGNENKDGYNYNTTNIIKFSLNEGELKFEKCKSIYGNLLNQFSMDEKDGYLRVVTTLNKYKIYNEEEEIAFNDFFEPTNNLYVLDENLETIGEINNIAKGETVYSVRFHGNIGYFVTFKQVDPLFSVDLSTPSNPTILGELKIPGFSEYMHPYDENLLLGLGKEATDEGRITGLKLSMFNTSNKEDLIEENKLVLEDYNYSYTFYNHKTITVLPSKNIISFPAINDYLIFEYSKDQGFIEKGKIPFNNTSNSDYIEGDNYTYEGEVRGIYIDNYLYVCTPNKIISYSLENSKEVSTLNLN